MSVAVKPQPVAGVSSTEKTTMLVVFPSIAATPLGRLIGRLMESIPLPCPARRIKLSYWVFGPLLALPAMLLYFWLKITGKRYVITNRTLEVWNASGRRLITEVPLERIGEVTWEQLPGQEYYRAANVVALDAAGEPLVELEGVPTPWTFREAVLKARDAHVKTLQALETIRQRQR